MVHRSRALLPLVALLAMAGCAPSDPGVITGSSEVASLPSEPVGSSGQPSRAPVATASAAVTPSEDGVPADPLLDVPLTDVRSGRSFTLAELAQEGPVLLEPMAVWCSNCRAQQHEVKRAHEIGSFVSVSLDVDLSETPEDLAAYAGREGFDWRFAMADASLYRLLQERFGVAATNPPSTPLIIIETDGTIRPLEFGAGTRSAEQLLAELGAG